MVAGGASEQVASQFLQPSGTTTPRSRRVDREGRHLRVVRYPPYPAGGINGGHVVVSVDLGAMTYAASVHGYGRVAVAVAVAVLLSMI